MTSGELSYPASNQASSIYLLASLLLIDGAGRCDVDQPHRFKGRIRPKLKIVEVAVLYSANERLPLAVGVLQPRTVLRVSNENVVTAAGDFDACTVGTEARSLPLRLLLTLWIRYSHGKSLPCRKIDSTVSESSGFCVGDGENIWA
jgi:hypothetical protein